MKAPQVRARGRILTVVAALVVLPFGAPTHAAQEPLSPSLALASMDRKLADLDADEQAGKAELGHLGRQLAEAHSRVVARGRNFYRMTRAGMLPLGGGFDALVAHAMRVERSKRTLLADLAAEQALRDRSFEVGRAIERIGRDRTAFAAQRSAMDTARLAVLEESRRQEAFDRAFESGSSPNDFVAIGGGGSGAGADFGGGSFAASKGRLLFPVLGRADVHPAHREGTKGPGLEVRSTAGAVVRAVFGGRVAFAERYGPYGRLVILDHGDHYYTVSGNLGTIEVHVGDALSAGDRLGTVGDDGQGAMLYFEVRKGGDTITPSPWLGL